MPRKVDPHSNEQSEALPTDYTEAFVIPEEVASFIPNNLSVQAKSCALKEIKYALGEYAWEMEVGPHRYSRAEASKALRDLLAGNDYNRRFLNALNQRAFNLLYDFADEKTRLWILSSDTSATPVEALRVSAQKAIAFNNEQRGPEKSIPLAFLVDRLCHAYENSTGQKVAHHTKTHDLAYTQDVQTEAGRFVTAIITAAFSGIPKTQINQCLRAFVRHRPKPF